MPECMIDRQFAALETPKGAISIDIDQPVEAIVSTIIRALNPATQ